MNSPDNTPKLRMAPVETPEQLAHRTEREQRAVELQREGNLEKSLAPFRVGSVRYLNAAPLVRGIVKTRLETTGTHLLLAIAKRLRPVCFRLET